MKITKLVNGVCLSCGKKCVRHVPFDIPFNLEAANKLVVGVEMEKNCKFCVHGTVKLEGVQGLKSHKTCGTGRSTYKITFGKYGYLGDSGG